MLNNFSLCVHDLHGKHFNHSLYISRKSLSHQKKSRYLMISLSFIMELLNSIKLLCIMLMFQIGKENDYEQIIRKNG